MAAYRLSPPITDKRKYHGVQTFHRATLPALRVTQHCAATQLPLIPSFVTSFTDVIYWCLINKTLAPLLTKYSTY